MRILVINTDYPRFLAELYSRQPELAHASYDVQMAARNDSLFGVADYYSRGFRAHGHEAWEVHLNNPWLQTAWAREHGIPAIDPPAPGELTLPPTHRSSKHVEHFKTLLRPLVRRFRSRLGGGVRLGDDELRIFLAQVEHYRPDVILNQDISFIGYDVLNDIAKRGTTMVGQIASPLPVGERFNCYDLMISSLPNFVQWFRERGVNAELNRLGFEPTLLDKLGPQPPRDVPVSFVGSLSPEHADRIKLLEAVAERVDLSLWGNGIERLPSSSILWRCYRGEAWGRDMYAALRRSQITINFHINLSEGFANNMRLYEATGVGTTLVTDAKRNLSDIFEPGAEVVSYSSPEDCVRQIEALLADPARCAAIGAAGQKRTIEEHNYYNRTGEIVGLVERLGG